METNEIMIMQSIYDENHKTALAFNKRLTEGNVFAVNVMGAPGAGKTSTLINLLPKLDCDCFVIEGDIKSQIDTEKLLDLGICAIQINTEGACHLDAPMVERAADELKVKNGMLFIENIGNLVCPAEFMIGEHIKMLICTVTEGSDKPYKYPLAFERADVIVLNKTDLMEYVDFNEDQFIEGIKDLNKEVKVFNVSAKNGDGFKELALWIKEIMYTKK